MSPLIEYPTEYWGELGFFRVEMGRNLLGIESHIAWATPGGWSIKNLPCNEDGSDCSNLNFEFYKDPSENIDLIKKRLKEISFGKKQSTSSRLR